MLIGAGSGYSVMSQGGASTHTLTVDELPAHKHSLNQVRVTASNTGNNSTVSAGSGSGNTPLNAETTIVGGGKAFSIMPPYVAVYIWRRTA